MWIAASSCCVFQRVLWAQDSWRVMWLNGRCVGVLWAIFAVMGVMVIEVMEGLFLPKQSSHRAKDNVSFVFLQVKNGNTHFAQNRAFSSFVLTSLIGSIKFWPACVIKGCSHQVNELFPVAWQRSGIYSWYFFSIVVHLAEQFLFCWSRVCIGSLS